MKIRFFLFLNLLANVCLCQEPDLDKVVSIQGNKNLRLTAKVIRIKSKHFIIPNLKMLSDTQDIQINREIMYGNENDPIVDCRFILQKLIKNKLVNMHLNQLYYPDVDREIRKFTAKDSLTDTVCIEDFIPLEPGQYLVTLELNYYLNGVKDIIYSDHASFFIPHAKSSYLKKQKR